MLRLVSEDLKRLPQSDIDQQSVASYRGENPWHS